MRRIISIASLALLVLVGACAQEAPDTQDEVTAKDGPTITVGSADFPESATLAEIYAQGLEAKGYKTDAKLNIGSRETYFPALERGDIDLFPEYTGSLLSYLTKQKKTADPDSDTTYDDLKTELEGRKVTLLTYADAQNKDVIVTNKETADELELTKISDLEEHAADLVMGGPPECKVRRACLKGLEDVYDLEFNEFKSLSAAGTQTVEALKANEIQVANLYSTDAPITANDFVVLTDDKGPLAGAENIVPVIRSETLEAYDEELVETIDAITETITTEGLRALNDRVVNDKEDASDVAADFLAEEDLL